MTAKRKRRKRRSAAPLIAVLLLIALAIGAFLFIHANYNVVMGGFYKKGEPIDLRGKSVSVRQYQDVARRCPDTEILWEIPIGQWRYDCLSEAIAVGDFDQSEVATFALFRNLGFVDARASTSTEAIVSLLDTYPALPVRWNIPIGGELYDNEAEEITVGNFSRDEIALFSRFTNLKQVDANAADCYPQILELREALGEDVTLKWNVVMGGESFAYTTKELSVPAGVDAAELAEKLAYLPVVKTVDTTLAQLTGDELRSLRETYPNLRFLYKVTIAGQSIRSNAENINIPESAALDVAELTAHGGDFPELKIINLGTRHMSLDDVIAIREAYGGVEVICRVTVCGKECSTDWTELDLSKRSIDDPAEAEKAIAAMANLKKLYLCDCGIPNETLAEMRARHDDCEIVWRVYLNGVDCRTDAEAFCMSKYSNSWGFLSFQNAEPIGYCTSMVTLDLGHANFDRMDFVSTMPHLKYLIVGGVNQLKSIEPLRNAEELYYLEMFFTDVHDLEPILHLPNLRHLNISHQRLNDYTQLFEMTQLERLWWVDSGLSEAQQNELREALPNTRICFWAWEDNAVGNYWRDDPSYREMRDNLGMNYNVIA